MTQPGQELYNMYADDMLRWYAVVVPMWEELTLDEQTLLNKITRTVSYADIHPNLAA